ncbi:MULTISPECIES: BhlA/UviB family holin-like peptide [unclassified Sedimentibacter]|uniref:BhlA/UviB family holin-like peptide n=1 Tax=unclassified Sedimentibacter TaxID=2649220 RepID=UPI0027DF42BF|nr:BhlA/UviB family holin-like peptide [Sedimentibacter sp. MB35-C1]WMJ77680.1 BhlA/UviB family holin-like peptide [Sedimentibacter sp. MB35-C1]
MEEKLFEVAATQGIWAVLSISLIFYILKAQEKRDTRQEEREKNYQNIITMLSDKLNIVEDIKSDISEIKNNIFNK